jgi:hypothetical protein
MTYFEVLGVSEYSSDDEVGAAHRRLAREFHPDAHPGVSAAERANYEAAMTRINVAYDAIRTGPRRADYLRAQGTASGRTSIYRPPAAGECDLCGSAPAQRFAFEYQTAWLLTVRRYRSVLELCRQCAFAMGRAHQNRTLYTGWWGVAAFFTNFGVVSRNAHQLRRARRLAPPEHQSIVIAPLPQPAPDTNGLFRRGGVWFATLVLAALCAVVFVVGQNASDRHADTAVVPWTVGTCVQGTQRVTAVDCSAPHDGQVVKIVSTPENCSPAADGFVARDSDRYLYCIAASR